MNTVSKDSYDLCYEQYVKLLTDYNDLVDLCIEMQNHIVKSKKEEFMKRYLELKTR